MIKRCEKVEKSSENLVIMDKMDTKKEYQ